MKFFEIFKKFHLNDKILSFGMKNSMKKSKNVTSVRSAIIQIKMTHAEFH